MPEHYFSLKKLSPSTTEEPICFGNKGFFLEGQGKSCLVNFWNHFPVREREKMEKIIKPVVIVFGLLLTAFVVVVVFLCLGVLFSPRVLLR